MHPLVSIVITNYNYADFLPEAIESALNQQYTPLEIIVVDDGSTDHSRSVLERYQSKLTVIYQSNQGQAAAFQSGMQAARGTYVLFLDADDVLYPNAIQTAVAAALPDTVKVQFFLRCVDAHRSPLGWTVPERMPKQRHVQSLLLQRGGYPSPPTSGNLWQRKFLDSVLPIPLQFGKLAADGYLSWLAPFFGTVVSVEEILGEYRIHTENRFAQADSLTNPQKLYRSLVADFQRTAAIQQTLQRYHIEADLEAALCHNADHIRRRFLLAQLAPALFHRLNRSEPSLLRYLQCVGESSELQPTTRVLWIVAGIITALAPRPLKRPIAQLLWHSQQRPAWLRRILRFFKRLGSRV